MYRRLETSFRERDIKFTPLFIHSQLNYFIQSLLLMMWERGESILPPGAAVMSPLLLHGLCTVQCQRTILQCVGNGNGVKC